MLGQPFKYTVLLSLVLYSFSITPCLADDTADAKNRFLEAVALVKKEQYQAALTAFEESYQLNPKTMVLFNMAMCYRALYQYQKSIATFERFIEEVGKKKPAKRKQAREAIAEMDRMLGRLKISDAPSGADVTIDGHSIGKTPLDAPLRLDPGKHTVDVTLDEYEPMHITVTLISDNELTVKASLTPAVATLEIDCHEENALVYIDGKTVGGCPYEGKLKPGDHDVRVDAPGLKTFEQHVLLSTDKATSLAVALEQEEPTPETVEQPTLVATSETDEDSKGVSGLLVGGIAATALGLGAGGLGIYFTAKGNHDEKAGIAASEEDKQKYRAALDRDIAGVVVGYVAAGLLLTTGAVLFVLNAKKKKRDDSASATVTPGGIAVTF
ncbi:MAG: PEGA domain-containing protein [Deltaproteobacteria bacterium]|nr:PEGA domain-containing protein [Deltaproteobacteria bacterium]